MVDEIWRAARKSFGPEIYKAWPMICRKWEHALWHWNDQYGPLTESQRDYFVSLILSCLHWAGNHPPAERYARYQASLMAKLNHEVVRAGFVRRSAEPPAGVQLAEWASTLPPMKSIPS